MSDFQDLNTVGVDGDSSELKLGGLIGFTTAFSESTLAEKVDACFTQNAKLPAVLVMKEQDDNELLGAISRATFFQMLSRKNGLVVYHPRPVSLMLQHSKVKMLVLPSSCSVREAVDLCLKRPQDHVYEPLVVSDPSGYKIIDFHSLIIAQTQLLHQTSLQSERQQVMLRKKNREILDSIFYAQRIQKSMLRDPGQMDKWGLRLFLIFKPRDIVSGDFFYVTAYHDHIFIAAVDCTGHGVPGAFMSMIGHNLLDDIITVRGIMEPNRILSCLHENIRRRLNQNNDAGSGRDGMDVCLCVVNPRTGQMSFSGAKRPLYYTNRQGESFSCKGDHFSIGGIQREQSRSFAAQEIALEPGQTFFLTTDGFVDQHSEDNRKFGSAQLQSLFHEIHSLSLESKQQALENALRQHQRNQIQRDDITLIGMEWIGTDNHFHS